MKIQALVLCDEFLCACIVEISHQSIELVFNHLLCFFIATHARAARKLLHQVCEQVKITCSLVWTVGRMEKISQAKSASSMHVLAVFTFWMTLVTIWQN
jgi:hypothetical protein